MYFKNLEMVGFKSFADRTAVGLEPGITAIIGPNGSGKSNVLDALRWVLGEQSAKTLRGSHMQDVIFNGSENRPATGMAEVTVTFDNADSRLPVDFPEVNVTRRLFRSGESEYLLNRAPCRLRDVQELFMDTGIGTNAYSLIGQGKIDLILSSKPEDRRFLFEEAAGIIKYKTRKRTAMRKLEGADQNLLRLRDIIVEVERQTKSLKRQVSAAMRHRKLTEELREFEIRHAWLQHQELTTAITDLKIRYAEAEKAYEGASAELTGLEAREEQLNLDRIEVERILMARREGVHQIDSEMDRIENEIALIRKEIEFSRHRQRQALEEHEEFTQRAARVIDEQHEIDQRAQEIHAEIEGCNRLVVEKQAEFDLLSSGVTTADQELETLRGQAVEAMNSRNRNQNEVETAEGSLTRIDAQLQVVYDRQNGQNARIETLAADLKGIHEREGERRAEQDRTEAARQSVQKEHAGSARQLADRNDELQSLREKKSSLEARLISLRELRDSYEGYAAGVRAVMQARQDGDRDCARVIGPVGDLLKTEKEFETAIEAALGGNINNIVAENGDAAKSAIEYLKRNRAGRVTFLPLDTIRSSSHDDSDALKGHRGLLGPAIDRVQYDPKIRPVIEYLLWNTMIVETIDDAIRIARAERRFPRLVTLEGEVVSSAGAVTGGLAKHQSRGLLGRSAEIEELEGHVERSTARITQLGREIGELGANIQGLARQLNELQSKADTLRRELAELGVAAAKSGTELENLQQAAAQLGLERDVLLAERAALEERRAEALQRASSIESDDEALQRRIGEAQEKSSRARQALSVCSDTLADARVRLAGLSQNLEETDRNRLREQREHEEALQEASRRLELVEELKTREKELDTFISDKVERSKALSETKEEAQEKVVEAQGRQQGLLDESTVVGKTLKDLRERASTHMKEVHALDKELTHDEDQVAFFQQRILEEYGIALASLTGEEVGTDELDNDAREAQIKHHRDALDRLGTVNLMAIEEYDVLEKRFQFLVAQEEDLRKARETLMGVIERIDKTITGMFLDTFNTVGENFKDYFRRLFNGGQARIYLLNEDDPLESGIEIEARPPGKKPQSISLLSGGEQALTAISLLFSIFKAKPSPFCVLDEVDAPLDDANIHRFLSLVDEFTNMSQFVIITHSKQTMAHADALYGVTQQERGVSEVVSVRFEDVAEAEAPV